MVYQPSDDSYLIEKQVKIYSKGKKVIDIGTGSGILALAAKKYGAKEVLAVDINDDAVKNVKKLGIDAVKSNLFSKVKGKFDLIVFNPPYLPFDREEDKDSALATTGGKKGDETIIKFLKQSANHLEKNGVILFLLSSLTPKDKIKKLLFELNFSYDVVSKKKIFFEELEVWKVTTDLE